MTVNTLYLLGLTCGVVTLWLLLQAPRRDTVTYNDNPLRWPVLEIR